MSKKPPANWEEIASAYRAGRLSNRQIAKQFGIAESTLRKRIASEGWEKTGAQKVRTSAPKVRTAAHSGQLAQKRPSPIVAEAIPEDIEGRLLCLAERMTDELEQITAHQGEISEAIEIETMDDENPRRREVMQKAISHPVRTNSLRTLAQAVALLGGKGASKKGKKEQLKDAAETASSGRFSPMHQPKLVVNNGK
ncbi:terminase [Gluconobacter wancherniae]|uniref:terminase n=1 Tax=Gluconobacter wancherniae TaxID=1307955 RepID=UPI001B8B3744|nr:terminase [Gluconobacter wancherniae]MBS1089097.1 terminase [Gluconobacter wancherniae]